LCIWLWLFFTGRYSGLANDFIAWVVQKGTLDWYAFPFMRLVGEWGYSFFGYSFFFLYPFALFFCGLLAILALAREFNYCNWKLFVFLFLVSDIIWHLGFFTHDAPMFFLVSVYAYFYFRFVYLKKGNFFFLLLLNVLMLFVRESGLVLSPLTFLALVKPRVLSFPSYPKYPSLICSTLLYPNFKANVFFGKTIYDWNASLQEGMKTFFVFHPANFFKYFYFPPFCLSFLAFFWKKDLHLLALIILTFCYVYSINSNPLFYTSVMRYSSSFVPLHLFYVLKP
jgi:hypothetical protein